MHCIQLCIWGFPAKNTVYLPYKYVSGQPYMCSPGVQAGVTEPSPFTYVVSGISNNNIFTAVTSARS